MCVCVCVCVRARAHVCVHLCVRVHCVHVCVIEYTEYALERVKLDEYFLFQKLSLFVFIVVCVVL